MVNKQLWYSRRGKEIRGPFPAKLISRYILLGRILESDELSRDQINWKPVSDIEELIPDEMKADLSIPENKEKLRLARLREDERQYGDRRQLDEKEVSDDIRRRRSGEERRESENMVVLRHRQIKTKTTQLLTSERESYRNPIIALIAGMLIVVGIAVFYSPGKKDVINNCNLAPRPEVDWSNCRFEALDLNSVNLKGANLQNTSLIAANLRGANLSDAQMSYVNLLNADVRDANLSNAKLMGAVMRKANFTAAKLNDSDISFAVLQDVDLSNADLSGANLTHVILSGAVITNANFSGAILDKAIWVDNTACAPGSVGRCVSP